MTIKLTIRLTVRLFGILSFRMPDYNHTKGLHFEVPEGVTPEDLLNNMKIPLSHVGLISCENRSIQKDFQLADKSTISFFSPLSGG